MHLCFIDKSHFGTYSVHPCSVHEMESLKNIKLMLFKFDTDFIRLS